MAYASKTSKTTPLLQASGGEPRNAPIEARTARTVDSSKPPSDGIGIVALEHDLDLAKNGRRIYRTSGAGWYKIKGATGHVPHHMDSSISPESPPPGVTTVVSADEPVGEDSREISAAVWDNVIVIGAGSSHHSLLGGDVSSTAYGMCWGRPSRSRNVAQRGDTTTAAAASFTGVQGGVSGTVETSDAGANSAIFTIHNTGSGAYTFEVTTAGSNYNSHDTVGDTTTVDKIVVLGTTLGGATPANDCTLTVQSNVVVTGSVPVTAGAVALSEANVVVTGTPPAHPVVVTNCTQRSFRWVAYTFCLYRHTKSVSEGVMFVVIVKSIIFICCFFGSLLASVIDPSGDLGWHPYDFTYLIHDLQTSTALVWVATVLMIALAAYFELLQCIAAYNALRIFLRIPDVLEGRALWRFDSAMHVCF